MFSKRELCLINGVERRINRNPCQNEQLGRRREKPMKARREATGAASSTVMNAKAHAHIKNTEKALWKSEEKYRFLVENSKEVILIISKKGRILFANRPALESFGYSEEEVTGKPITRFLARDCIGKALKAVAREFLGKPYPEIEIKAKAKSGEIRNLVVAAGSTPIYHNGKLSGIMISATDITEHKRVEDKLRRSEMVYRALFEHASDAVFLMNLEGVHMAVNKKAADMLGYSREELVGKSYKEIVAASEIGNATDRLNGLLEGRSFPLYERFFRKKDGSEFPVEINVSVVRDPENKPLFIQSIVRDITERKRADEKVRASLREKEILLQEIHHRVKNNMQIISSLHKLQSSTIKDKEALEIFKSIQNRVKSMALIHEKLYQSDNFARVDLAEYVRSLVSYLSSSHALCQPGIKFYVDIKNVFLDINTAVPCGLIINELVSNALRHAFVDGKKGEIRIRMQPLNEKEVELSVSDNGIGLPENLDFRKTNSLGLHLVTLLAENQLHGKVRYERNGGTHFHVRLRIKK